jgi:hypothetical protein
MEVRMDDTTESTEVARATDGKWLPGVSGNPHGRPKGAKSRATQLREALDDALMEEISHHYYDVLMAMIQAAKDGDVQAGKLVLKDMAAIKADREGDKSDKEVTVIIQNYTGESLNGKAEC